MMARKRTVSPGYAPLPTHECEIDANETSINSSVDKKSGDGGGYINMDSAGSPREDVSGFSKLIIVTEAVGLALLILVSFWVFEIRGGFGWRSHPAHEFNIHPFLMVLSMVLINSNSMLTYRALRTKPKMTLKLIHGGLQLVGFPLMIVGLVAVFDSHNFNKDKAGLDSPIPNLYSLHSWVGLIVVIFFVIQWLFGLVTYLFPGLRADVRTFAMPYHVYFGTGIFVASVATCLLGLNEKAIFNQNYSALPTEAVIMNIIGLVLFIYAGLVVFLTTKAEFKRMPRPEDGSPLLTGPK